MNEFIGKVLWKNKFFITIVFVVYCLFGAFGSSALFYCRIMGEFDGRVEFETGKHWRGKKSIEANNETKRMLLVTSWKLLIFSNKEVISWNLFLWWYYLVIAIFFVKKVSFIIP